MNPLQLASLKQNVNLRKVIVPELTYQERVLQKSQTRSCVICDESFIRVPGSKKTTCDNMFCVNENKKYRSQKISEERLQNRIRQAQHNQATFVLIETQEILVEKKVQQKKVHHKPRVPVKDNERKINMFDVRCPNPYKKVYRTKEEALSFIQNTHDDSPRLRPYPCRCGAIHIGNNKRRKRNRKQNK